MVINTTVQKAINEQINFELASAYIYLAMAAHFEENDFAGFAAWMNKQAQEEVGHAMKLFGYVHERGGTVELGAIAKPPASFESPLAVFKMAYEHEQVVTQRIHDIYHLAVEHKDLATQSHLQWFIDEQVEEEDSAAAIVAKLEMAGDNKGALFILDRELGARDSDGH